MKLLIFLLFVSSFGFANSIKEDRKRVVLIDTSVTQAVYDNYKQYFCQDEQIINATKASVWDNYPYHGTKVFLTAVEKIDQNKYCFTLVKWLDLATSKSDYFKALKKTIELDPSYVNISVNGYEFDIEEKELLDKLTKNSRVIVAAGNNHIDLGVKCVAFPSCYRVAYPKHFFSVGAYDSFGILANYSNYGGIVKEYRYGGPICYDKACSAGTSFAAPAFLNELLRK